MSDGVRFEERVESWLRKERGARFTERRARLQGRVASRGHEVDVHATARSSLWVFFLLVAIGAGVLGTEPAVDAAATVTLLLVTAAASVASYALFRPRHFWVECKSGDTNVRRDVVWKLVMQVVDARELRQDWYPSEVWLVSRAGFDVDAIKFARESKIRCFIEERGTFREVV